MGVPSRGHRSRDELRLAKNSRLAAHFLESTALDSLQLTLLKPFRVSHHRGTLMGGEVLVQAWRWNRSPAAILPEPPQGAHNVPLIQTPVTRRPLPRVLDLRRLTP